MLNVGAPSWQNWLLERICRVVDQFGVDAVFLDITLMWVNDPHHDMHAGTCQLVDALRSQHPEVLVVGEGWYDALLGVIPMCQGAPPPLFPRLLTKYARAVGHLSQPAPGHGSTGVHEYGFRGFDGSTLELIPDQIPTIAIVDDTFEKHRDVLEAIIRKANGRHTR
jgi:hypothetical protein